LRRPTREAAPASPAQAVFPELVADELKGALATPDQRGRAGFAGASRLPLSWSQTSSRARAGAVRRALVRPDCGCGPDYPDPVLECPIAKVSDG